MHAIKKFMTTENIHIRSEVNADDLAAVRDILESAGMFQPYEIDVGVELVEDRLKKGEQSEYQFLFAEDAESTVGYVCYGPVTVTDRRFDLYWIAVRKDQWGRGIGGRLLSRAEHEMKRQGCPLVFVETSSRNEYEPTRSFYRKYGYREVAWIPDFYQDQDDKLIFMKRL